jgi:tripartite-type tricarboxylate transporter receptor subunit TctC
MIVPFPPGGPSDVLARIIAEPMRASLGQPVIVENVSGGAGSIGVGRVARAPADGYTLSLGNLGTHVFNAAIYNLPYDPVTDFEPVSLLPANNHLILTSTKVPSATLQELIEWVKANSHRVTGGTGGPGSPSHLAALYFQQVIGARYELVPYRGTPLAMQDLIGGHIDILFDQVASALPVVSSGSIKAFAVTADRRLAAAPGIPTADEAGLPKFYTSQWFGLWVPRGTSREVIQRLNSAVVSALANDSTRAKLAELGMTIPPPEQQTPAALGALQRSELQKWQPLIKQAGVHPQ